MPSIQRSAFRADSMPVSTKSESECLTPPAGLNHPKEQTAWNESTKGSLVPTIQKKKKKNPDFVVAQKVKKKNQVDDTK